MNGSSPASSVSEEVFLSEKAPFPPPLALLGYVSLPTFGSYCPQTPSKEQMNRPLTLARQRPTSLESEISFTIPN
jgi:hypothetical protein